MSNARNLANLLSPGASALAAAKVPAITVSSITDPDNLPGQSGKVVLDNSSVATVTVNGAVSGSTTVAVDGVSGTIAVGMVVNVSDTTVRSISDASSETAISVDDTLTITAVASQTSFTVSEAVSIANNVVLILRADENGKMVMDASAASTDVGDEILFEDATNDPNTLLNSSDVGLGANFNFTQAPNFNAGILGAGMVLVHEITVTSTVANIAFTQEYITDTYNSYYIIHKGLTFDGDDGALRMNLSIDNGANLITSGVTGAAYHQLMNAASSGHTPNSKAYHPFSEAEDTVGYATGHCWYHNLRDTTATYKYTMGDSVNHHSGSYEVSYQSACLHTTTAPVNYIRYFSGDNLTGGKFSLYGITGGL